MKSISSFQFKTTLLLAIIILSSFSVSAKKKFPKYEEIVTTFFKQYDRREGQDMYSLKFVKKKEGYFICEYTKNYKTIKNEWMFWSAKKKKYFKLDFPETTNNNKSIVDQYLTIQEAYLFDLYPYYNYTGYHHDNIQAYYRKNKLSDDELYALGRNYSTAASEVIHKYNIFTDSTKLLTYSDTLQNQLTPEGLNIYYSYIDGAINAFSELAKRNPDYKTIVGPITVKAANEYVVKYYDLLQYQNHETAKEALKPDIYDDFYIEAAKNMLNGCEPDAILFTYGDSDTYPLLYIQEMENFRRDVLIINQSLLMTNRYENFIFRKQYPYAKKVESILALHVMLDNQLDYVISKEIKESDCPPIKAVFNQLNKNSKHATEKYKLDTIPSLMRFQTENPNLAFQLNFDKAYLIRGELMITNIIEANFAKSPIYFAATSFVLDAINDNIESHGYVYKLINDTPSHIKHNDRNCGIDINKAYRYLINECYYTNLTPSTSSKNYFLKSYLTALDHLVFALSENNEKDSCLIVVKYIMEKFPNNDLIEPYYKINVLEACIKLGFTEEYKNLLDEALVYLKKCVEDPDLDEASLYMAAFNGQVISLLLAKYEIANDEAKAYFDTLMKRHQQTVNN